MFNEVVLKNGLKMYLYSDKTKNRTSAHLFTIAGSKDTTFYVDDKEKKVVNGTAHFLEHYLVERSIYGNSLQVLSEEYVDYNAATGIDYTDFHISTVHDFKDNYIKLLNIVNNPIFSQDRVNDTIKPIVSEIARKEDNKYLEYNRVVNNAIYKNGLYDVGLGTVEDIQNMKYTMIKDFYDAFYYPSNQIIIITGNFDEKEIVKLTEDTYNKFNKENKNTKHKESNEDDKLVSTYSEYNKDLKEHLFTVSYKLNFKGYTPEEKNKIDFYISYLLQSNTGSESKLYQDLLNEKLITYSFDSIFESAFNKDYPMISIYNDSQNSDEVIKRLTDRLKEPIFSEDNFNRWKNNLIIERINSMEKVGFLRKNFIDNLLKYNYKSVDTLDFIKSFNLDECKKLLGNLNFTDYSIVKNIVKEDTK
jgi:predicted Zn-dependent peptidase